MATSNKHSTTHIEGSTIKWKHKASFHWMMAILVPDALYAQLHVLEDDRMISWLGRDKFVDLSIHGTNGWQYRGKCPCVSSYIFLFLNSLLKFQVQYCFSLRDVRSLTS